LAGLLPAPATLLVHALAIKQHLKKPLSLDSGLADLELRLEPIALAEPADAVELWGLKLATITPAVREAYFLEPQMFGVIILDPGTQSARLGVGELQEGDCLRLLDHGRLRTKTVLQFVEQVRHQIAHTEAGPPYHVQVNRYVNRVDGSWNSSPPMALTADDVRQLEAVVAELARRPPVDTGPKHGFLGLSPQEITQPGVTGVRIDSVQPNSPAARAGLAEGEIIVQVDGVEIHTPADLVKLVRSRKPGDTIRLKLLDTSAAAQQEVAVTLDEF
jgi:PDZ domain